MPHIGCSCQHRVILYAGVVLKDTLCYFRPMATKTKVLKNDKFLHIRISKPHLEIYQKAASTLGISLSDWVRMRLVEVAQAEAAGKK